MGRTLGAEIRRLRFLQPGMRQEDLAHAIGVQAPQITTYETDHVRPDAATLAKIAAALGVDLAHFAAFGGAYDASAPRRVRRRRRVVQALDMTDPDSYGLPAPVTMFEVDDPIILRLGGPMGYALAVKVAAIINVRRLRMRSVIDTIDACLREIETDGEL